MLDSRFTASSTDLATAMQDLVDVHYDDVWSESRRLKIRGSLGKAAKAYEVLAGILSPELIPCDVTSHDELCRPYLERRSVPPRCGFKSFDSFYTWWSNTRSFFDVVSGKRGLGRALVAQDDDWAELLAHLNGKRGGYVVLGGVELIRINRLARECRAAELSIRDLTGDVVATLAEDLDAGERRALREACRSLDNLRGLNQIPFDLLPSEPIGPLPHFSSKLMRRVPQLHEEFARLIDRYLESLRQGSRPVRFGTQQRILQTTTIGRARIKNIRVALRWYWHGLVALDVACHDRPIDMRAITDPVLIHDIGEACSRGRLGSMCSSEERRRRVQEAVKFLTFLRPDFRLEVLESFLDAAFLSFQNPQEKPNRHRKEQACLEFIHDEARQYRFFAMPKTFFDEARPLIARYDELGPRDEPGVSKDQHRALDLAIMAALSAIITRIPLRLNTIAWIESAGMRPHLLFPAQGEHCGSAVLDIPGAITKNGHGLSAVPLLAGRKVDPRKILTWYLKCAHPLVLRCKLKRRENRRPERLFGGLGTDTLRVIWNRLLPDVGIDATPHMARHFIASLLYHEGVPMKHGAQGHPIGRDRVHL